MFNYINLGKEILSTGVIKEDRTGTGTISIVGGHLTFDLRQGFPILTTKKLGLKTIFTELQFFLKGETNVKWLQDRNCRIWDQWGYKGSNPEIEKGYLGPVYGQMWNQWEDIRVFDDQSHIPKDYSYIGEIYDVRDYRSKTIAIKNINQLDNLYKALEERSNSRRIIVSGWNPALLPIEGNSHDSNIEKGYQVLPPCHLLWQVIIEPNKEDENKPFLNLVLTQRSADYMLGVPFNIASYALLLELLAFKYGYIAKKLVLNFGDTHIYHNQVKGAQEQFNRTPRKLPKLIINKDNGSHFLDFDLLERPISELFHLEGYDPHPSIEFPPVAV